MATGERKRKGIRRTQEEESNPSSSSTSTLSAMSNFPLNNLEDELLIEILVRLPTPQSAICCEVVSKRWYTLISTPYFIRRFITHHMNHDAVTSNDGCDNDRKENGMRFYQKPSGIVVSYCKPDHLPAFFVTGNDPMFNSPRFSLTFLPKSVRILASCHDILLCGAVEMRRNSFPTYYICNPLTMQWVTLPLLSRKYNQVHEYGFVCQPFYCRDVNVDGGYTVDTKYRYRVVVFLTDHLEVYCSETGKWNEYALPHLDDFFSNVVSYNGKLHWHNGDNNNIVVCDPFEAGHISVIGGPELRTLVYPKDQNCFSDYCIGVCRGCLQMIQLVIEFNTGDVTLRVWELDYETGKWNVEHNIGFHKMMSECSVVNKFMAHSILALHPANEEIAYLDFENHVVSCQLQDGELKEAGKIRPGNNFGSRKDVFPILLPWWPTPISSVPSDANL